MSNGAFALAALLAGAASAKAPAAGCTPPESYVAPPKSARPVKPENLDALAKAVAKHGLELPGLVVAYEALATDATVAEVERAVEQDVLLREAGANLLAIAVAEARWARAHDGKPLLWTDENREEVWKQLRIPLPYGTKHHRYAIALDSEGWVFSARGSTDADSFEDRVIAYSTLRTETDVTGPIYGAADSVNYEMTTFHFAPSSLDKGTPAWLERLYETDRRSATAEQNIRAILRAEDILLSHEGRVVLFENGGPEDWRKLGIALPAGVYHRYSVRQVDKSGTTWLEIEARGDLDGDAAEDRWALRLWEHPEKPWAASPTHEWEDVKRTLPDELLELTTSKPK